RISKISKSLGTMIRQRFPGDLCGRPSIVESLNHRNRCDHLITTTAAIEQSARLPDREPFLRELQRKAIGISRSAECFGRQQTSSLMMPMLPGSWRRIHRDDYF